MAEIIDSTTDIKEYLSVNVDISFKSLKPYIDNALIESILPFLGQDIIDDIETNVASSIAPYDEMIPMIQRTLTYFGVLKALPFIEVNIGDEGVTRTESQNYKTAYRGQVARIETQLKSDAYNSFERLLLFLEANKATYMLWPDAPGYVEFSNYLFRDSSNFSYYYPLKYGRLTYNRILPSMRYVTEFTVKAEIGSKTYDDLFLKKSSPTNSPEETQALEYLKNAVAHLTIAHSLIDGWTTFSEHGVHFTEQVQDIKEYSQAETEQLTSKINVIENRGKSYLAILVKYLNDNLDDFPVFRDDNSVVKSNDDSSTSAGGVKGFFHV